VTAEACPAPVLESGRSCCPSEFNNPRPVARLLGLPAPAARTPLRAGASEADVSETKVCSTCGAEKDIEQFERMPECRGGRRGQCRTCINARRKPNRLRLYHSRPLDERQASVRRQYAKNREQRIAAAHAWSAAHKAETSERNRRYAAANGFRLRAKKAVDKAIRNGLLVRPTSCEWCSAIGGTIEGHHPSYAPDQWLVVTWICRSCHKRHHAAERLAERVAK
jgi:hypothetical protein